MNQFFDTFQITCLAFFLIVFAGRTLYMRFVKNINPLALGIGKQGLKQMIELSFFIVLLAWVVEVLLAALHTQTRLFPPPFHVILLDAAPLKLAGAALVLLSFAIFIWALVSFRDSWRVGIDKKTKGELVTTGIFAYSRNPIFIFIDLYLIGTFFINGSLIFLLFAAAAVTGLHYQILQEEKYLSAAYGADYQAYCAKTARYWSLNRKLCKIDTTGCRHDR